MATKKLRVVTAQKTSSSTTSTISAPAAVESAAYFTVGETAYYTLNGVQVPVIVVSEQATGKASAQGDTVLYTVIGDISGNGYPKGFGRGPFKGVSSSSLTSR